MASRRSAQMLEQFFQCMRLIHEDGNITSRALAEQLQISNGAAYYVLNALINKGYVKVENFKNNPKKSGYFYLLTPAGLREKSKLTSKFIQSKKREYRALRAEIEALERENFLSKY